VLRKVLTRWSHKNILKHSKLADGLCVYPKLIERIELSVHQEEVGRKANGKWKINEQAAKRLKRALPQGRGCVIKLGRVMSHV
jgi:hypothetical protein